MAARFRGVIVVACAAGTDQGPPGDPGSGGSGTTQGSGGSGGNVSGTGGNVSGSGGSVSGSGGSVSGSGGSVSGSGGATGTGGNVSGSGGATGTGGGTAGAGGSAGSAAGGSAGAGTGGGNASDTTCGKGVTPVGIGRCATGLVVAKGTALTIDNFEEPGDKNDYLGVFFADGRSGEWFYGDSNNNSGVMKVEIPAGESSRAMHYHGAAPGAWAALGVAIANCYDASAYRGISFSIKGNPGAGNDTVKFNVHTPVSEPVSNGGGCSDADNLAGKCHDHFAQTIPVTSQWVRHNIKWTDLKQNCSSNNPPGFNPAKQIVTLSFSIPKATAGYDIWIDNLSFDTGDLPTNKLSDIVSSATFDEMWTTITPAGVTQNLKNPFYKYADMVTAVSGYGAMCTTGDPTTRRLEAAAFFSNVAHETDSLGIVEENNCSPNKCPQYGTAPNGQTYHGRGPIQLTLKVNYQNAGAGLGLGTQLSDNPSKVSTDASIAWRTGFWFWNSGTSGGGTTPHQAITGGQGFGETIRIINGIECGGANAAAVQDRIKHFRRFCYMFGIDPGSGNLGC